MTFMRSPIIQVRIMQARIIQAGRRTGGPALTGRPDGPGADHCAGLGGAGPGISCGAAILSARSAMA